MARLGRGYPGPARWVRPHGSTTAAVVLAAVAATATVAAPAPTLTKGAIPVPAAAVTVSAPTPTLLVAVRFDAPTASVTVSAPVPTLTRSALRPPAAIVTASAPAPTLGVSGGPVPLAPPAATATASAPAPTLARSALRPPAATVVAAAITPSLNISGSPLELAPPAATVTASAPAPTLTIPVDLEAWTVGEAGQSLIEFADDLAVLTVDPPAATAPPDVTARIIRVLVQDMPILTPDANGRYHSDGNYGTTRSVAGVLHTIVDGIDVTYYGGIPTVVNDFSFVEPFGEEDATIEFPGIPFFVKNGEPDSLPWLGHDREVEFVLVEGDGTRHSLWSGLLTRDVTSDTENSTGTVWEAAGLLWTQIKNAPFHVRAYMPPTDVGWVIADVLNAVPNRRYAEIPRVTTGIPTRERGTGLFYVNDYASKLLSTAFDSATGQQWTLARVGRGEYRIVLKHETIDYTLVAGTPGVDLEGLTRDRDEAPNVFYGHGYTPNGFPFRGMRYIAPLIDPKPAFPGTITVGASSDAIRQMEWRLFYLGYGTPIDGTFDSGDAATIIRLQTDFQLTVTGTVTSETWDAIFEVGTGADDLDASYRAPLAQDPSTDKYLRAPNGAILGVRPDWDRKVKIVAVDIDGGSDITFGELASSLRARLARDSSGSLAGDVTLKTDPPEGSRVLAAAGVNLQLKNYRGGDFATGFADWKLRASRVEVRPNDKFLPVKFSVDSKAKDYMTLEQQLQRDRASKADPARKPGAVNLRSRQSANITDQFDGEAGGGQVPEHFVPGGQWNLIRIPVEQVNRFTSIEYRVTARSAIVLLGAEWVFVSQLALITPNPLAVKDWAKDERWDALGFIQSWGMLDDAMGFSEGQESSGDPFTGRLTDTGGVEFELAHSPWMWIGEFSETDSHMSATLLPARNNS